MLWPPAFVATRPCAHPPLWQPGVLATRRTLMSRALHPVVPAVGPVSESRRASVGSYLQTLLGLVFLVGGGWLLREALGDYSWGEIFRHVKGISSGDALGLGFALL